MVNVQFIPINLGQRLGKQPLSRSEPQLRPGDVLAVEDSLNRAVAPLAFNPVVRSVIHDVHQIIGHLDEPNLARAHVKRTERVAHIQCPLPDSGFGWHSLLPTDLL